MMIKKSKQKIKLFQGCTRLSGLQTCADLQATAQPCRAEVLLPVQHCIVVRSEVEWWVDGADGLVCSGLLAPLHTATTTYTLPSEYTLA